MKRQLQSGAIPPDPEITIKEGTENSELSPALHPVGQDLRWEAFSCMAANFPGNAMDDEAAAERRPDVLCRRRTKRWPAGRRGYG